MTTHKKALTGLTLGALGIVFGDIGTSPLYALQALFGIHGQQLTISSTNIYGILSLIIWSVTIIVSIKYIGFLMRSHNEGEGGIMALVALLKTSTLARRSLWGFTILGIIGVALFYGDSAITPAISILSAVEGLHVIAPQFSPYIIPITLLLIIGLFFIQRYGTSVIGRLFGPVMLVWFMTIGLGGFGQVWQHPDILITLSPLTALGFFAAHPVVAFVAMGAIVLAITGAEALYADMGHFGRAPIARAWFLLVFPALLLCYMGQGALLLHTPLPAENSLLLLFPDSLRTSVVILATLATLIASQSVISGAFSLTRQAVQLNFLPRLLIRHTSIHESGQVYVPFVNFLLLIIVSGLVLTFQSSANLASAYGVAISGALLVDTLLFIVIMMSRQVRAHWAILVAIVLFLPLDLLFSASNLTKIIHGGWFPIALGLIAFTLMTTWSKGQAVVSRERRRVEGPLQALIDVVQQKKDAIARVPGQAIYISHHPSFAPQALHAAIEQMKELHEQVVIVSVLITNAAHIPFERRATFSTLEYDDGISYLVLSYGYHDVPDVPTTMKQLRSHIPELNFDATHATYFVSQNTITPTKRHTMAAWRKRLYIFMARNAVSSSSYYHLPSKRTVEVQTILSL
jgi:KUP system potassium uptake protein